MTKVSELAERLLADADCVDTDELAALLGSVRRIADGVGAIHELAIAIAQRPDPPAATDRLQLLPVDVDKLRRMAALSEEAGLTTVVVPARWVRALLRAVDAPESVL